MRVFLVFFLVFFSIFLMTFDVFISWLSCFLEFLGCFWLGPFERRLEFWPWESYRTPPPPPERTFWFSFLLIALRKATQKLPEKTSEELPLSLLLARTHGRVVASETLKIQRPLKLCHKCLSGFQRSVQIYKLCNITWWFEAFSRRSKQITPPQSLLINDLAPTKKWLWLKKGYLRVLLVQGNINNTVVPKGLLFEPKHKKTKPAREIKLNEWLFGAFSRLFEVLEGFEKKKVLPLHDELDPSDWWVLAESAEFASLRTSKAFFSGPIKKKGGLLKNLTRQKAFHTFCFYNLWCVWN